MPVTWRKHLGEDETSAQREKAPCAQQTLEKEQLGKRHEFLELKHESREEPPTPPEFGFLIAPRPQGSPFPEAGPSRRAPRPHLKTPLGQAPRPQCARAAQAIVAGVAQAAKRLPDARSSVWGTC